MQTEKRSTYIDQWRGLSVLLVIANHLVLYRYRLAFLGHGKGETIESKLAAKAVWLINLWGINAGMLGVCIFFVISGYLISMLLLKEESRNGKVSLSAFYARRLLRICPALVLYVVGILLLDQAGGVKIDRSEVLESNLFLCNTTLVTCSWQFGHLWSLGVEEQFYVFWPVLLLLLGRWRVPFVSVAFAIALICGAIPALRIGGWLNNGESFACILAGVLYALSPRLRAVLALAKRVPFAVWFCYLVLFLPFARTRFGSLDAVLMLSLPLAIVVCVLVESGSLIPNRGAANVLTFIGTMSYSLYLWGVFTWEPERYLTPWLAYGSFLAPVVAWLSFRYVETPFIEVGRRLSARLSGGAAARPLIPPERSA